jgi:DNA-binding transcriptional ArsR family regulator
MSHTLDAAFSALADPTRRAILAMLLEDDMAVTDVAEPFEMSLAAISKHLGILTRAGSSARNSAGA